MLVESLKKIFRRDLLKLRDEITAYRSEDKIWVVAGEIVNPAGNLCLHLVGNLNHFIGEVIGNTGYVRDRELEFSAKAVPVKEIVGKIDDTMEVIGQVLNGLSDSDLEKEYPIVVFEEKMSTGFFLVHLASHLSYHLGQVNYHRRLLSQETAG